MQPSKIRKTDPNQRYRRDNKLFAVPRSAPRLDQDDWPDMTDTGWGAAIFKHYGAPPYWKDYQAEETLRAGGGM